MLLIVVEVHCLRNEYLNHALYLTHSGDIKNLTKGAKVYFPVFVEGEFPASDLLLLALQIRASMLGASPLSLRALPRSPPPSSHSSSSIWTSKDQMT